MAFWTRFFGGAGSQAAGFAIGATAVPALTPAIQDLINIAWATHPSRPLQAIQLAQGVASGQLARDVAVQDATFNGIHPDRFDNLVRVFDAGPGQGSAFQLWRRGLLTEAAFRRALKRESLEPEWIDALVGLKNVLLSPADLAMMRQQGFVDVDRQREESARQGVTNERADLLFEISGLPPGIEPATEALHRGFINDDGFAQIVREGHTKTKYTDLLLRLAVPLLSPATIVNLYLRGWISETTYHNRMALHGYSAEQADDWFKSAGRPAAPVQMMTAWARGVDGPDGSPMDRTQFLKGIRESDIRPEWGPMLWGIRHAYPSLFQLRGAVQAGYISRERALQILHFERYEERDATALVDGWLRGGGTSGKGLTVGEVTAEYEGLYIDRDEYLRELQGFGYSAQEAEARAFAADARRTKIYRDAAIRAVRHRFNLHRASVAEARASLVELSVPDGAIDLLITLWTLEREEKTAVLTPAQVKKAWKKALMTRAEAMSELEDRGYSQREANVLLDE